MWQDRVLLGQFTDREDFLTTVSLFDDDTGSPINLTGLALAMPGAPFTASAWTVTDGTVSTSSTTSIMLPGLPIGGTNNLSALALTVGTGLNIRQGDPISITDTATMKNTATGFVTSYASATGALVVQIGWTYQFEIRRGGPRNTGSGYIGWWDWGTPDDLGPLLSANFSNGFLSLTDQNVLQINIPASIVQTIGDQYSSLDRAQADTPGQYEANMIGTDGVNTRQFFKGLVTFFAGGVTSVVPVNSGVSVSGTLLVSEGGIFLTP